MKHEHRPKNFSFLRFGFSRFVVASILVHISIFCLLFLSAQFESKKNKAEIIEITFVDKENEKIKTINPTQIVESDSADANNELNENAKFLSEKSNTVKKETKASSGNKFQNAKKSAPTLNQKQKQFLPKAKSQASRPQLFDKDFDAYSALNKKTTISQEFQKLQPGARSEDSSTTNDKLDEIENELMTRLNTKEYRYYGYYSRIKTQLNQWWVPKVQQKYTKMIKQGRTIASEENKITKLVIVLNEAGHLVKVQVMAESGIKDLDDAAIEAFRSAAPFPNPPKGMVDKDGLVKIRWDCVVES